MQASNHRDQQTSCILLTTVVTVVIVLYPNLQSILSVLVSRVTIISVICWPTGPQKEQSDNGMTGNTSYDRQ